MISSAAKRSILRWIHLIFTIPILGYVYSPFEELPNYAPVVRFVFVPVLILSGFWMYAGIFFAIIGVALWLGAYYLSGYGAAILSLVALFIARKTWLVIRARQSKDRPNRGQLFTRHSDKKKTSMKGVETKKERSCSR
jgi:hypothetical protein